MTIGDEEEKTKAIEILIKAMHASPESFPKCNDGVIFGSHIVESAKAIQEYLFPKNS